MEWNPIDPIWRDMGLRDIDACLSLPLMDEHAYDCGLRAAIPGMWRELLAHGYVEARVLEDRDHPSRSLLGYGFMVYLSDAFMAEARDGLPPYINREILQRWRIGRSPILNAREVALANSGNGLNQHTFHQGFSGAFIRLLPPHLDKIIDEFFALSRGYFIRETSIETYSAEQLQANLFGGFRVRTAAGDPAGTLPPFFIGMNREESRESIGSAISRIFSYVHPRFFFSAPQQELLRHALFGHTDPELADYLCLTIAGVRKRWASIYRVVAAVNPALLPEEPNGNGAAGGRGAEKRRRLLDYLRNHPEELRPLCRKRR